MATRLWNRCLVAPAGHRSPAERGHGSIAPCALRGADTDVLPPAMYPRWSAGARLISVLHLDQVESRPEAVKVMLLRVLEDPAAWISLLRSLHFPRLRR